MAKGSNNQRIGESETERMNTMKIERARGERKE